jgi:hypothetical protein
LIWINAHPDIWRYQIEMNTIVDILDEPRRQRNGRIWQPMLFCHSHDIVRLRKTGGAMTDSRPQNGDR